MANTSTAAAAAAASAARAAPMTLPQWTVVGFTGHRALPNPAAVAAAIGRVLDRLAQSHAPLGAISSAAAGADTLFLEAVAARKLPLMVLLPFPAERFRDDFSPDEWRRAEPLIAAAQRVETLREAESPEEAYLETGIIMVDRCDVLLAVWNGKPAAGTGGTAEVIDYARRVRKPVIRIDADTGAVSEDDLAVLPAKDSTAGLDGRTPEEAVRAFFTAADAHASGHAPRARQMVLYIIVLHLLATSVALIPLAYEYHGPWSAVAGAVKVLCLVAALVLAWRHRHAHHQWIRTRLEAEHCRSFLDVWGFRRHVRPFARRPVHGFERLYRDLQIAWYLDHNPPLDLDDARRHYLDERVGGQIRYFERHRDRAQRIVRRAKAVAYSATVAAILCGMTALVLSLTHRDHGLAYPTAKLLSLALPLLSAGGLSWVVSNDLARRASRFEEMAAMLRDVAKRLETSRTWPGLADIAAETEELLLREVAEWHSASLLTGEAH